jgi:hypothetical protein
VRGRLWWGGGGGVVPRGHERCRVGAGRWEGREVGARQGECGDVMMMWRLES